MKSLRYTAVLPLFALIGSALAADPSYKIVNRIKMPDGYWDYGASDASKGLIYWSRAEFTDVIDSKTGALSQLKSAGNAHMALPVPGTTLIVLPLRSPPRTVRIVDSGTDKAVSEVQVGDQPDGMTYDPFSKHVFVVNHSGSDVTEIDPIAGKAIATIPVGGGKLEFADTDGRGHVFVNIQASGEIAVIDVAAHKVTTHYKMQGCEDATGLAYAAKTNLLIASCGNGVAKAVAADSGKELASIPIGKGPDAVIYDSSRQIAFIPSGVDGMLQIISVVDPAHIVLIQQLPTQILARTGAIDLNSGKLYLMAAQPDPTKPTGGGGRPTPKDGTFEMLVIGPGEGK
jgi:DNA-binding beta-propeller fold protein YncE